MTIYKLNDGINLYIRVIMIVPDRMRARHARRTCMGISIAHAQISKQEAQHLQREDPVKPIIRAP